MYVDSGGRRVRLRGALMLALALSATVARAATFDPIEASIDDLQEAYKKRKVTAVSVVKRYLGRIDKQDVKGAKINSVIVNPNALAEAAEADRLRKAGIVLGPLHGVPFIVKDSYAVKGMPTTNGIAAWKALVATDDAVNVKLLRQAGAIIIGKANMSTFAFSYDGISEAWGPVKNPFNPNRTPGGSSSGTGAAVGANFAMIGMGGETGGSIRIPSDYNGLVGLKPTLGLIPANGCVPLLPSRDVIGPIAKSVKDVAYAMDVLAQVDPNDAFQPEFLWEPTPEQPSRRPPTYLAFLDEHALEGKVLGVLKPYIGKGTPDLGSALPLHPEVEALFEEALLDLEDQGATLVEVTPPAHTLYFVDQALNTPAWAALGFPPDFVTSFGVTDPGLGNAVYYYDQFFRHFAPPPYTSLPAAASIMPTDPGFSFFSDLLLAAYAGGNVVPNSAPVAQQYYAAIRKLREQYLDAWMAEMGIDALVAPTSTVPAFKQLDDPGVGQYGDNLAARFESNTLGLPAITVPMGFYPNGVPGTLQFIGSFYGEGEIIGYAYDYEQATLHRTKPKLRAARRIRECKGLKNGKCAK
ncbi:MAG: amidase [bacterium]|nr:amidase [bacterium]